MPADAVPGLLTRSVLESAGAIRPGFSGDVVPLPAGLPLIADPWSVADRLHAVYLRAYSRRSRRCFGPAEFGRRMSEDRWVFLGTPEEYVVVKPELRQPVWKAVLAVGRPVFLHRLLSRLDVPLWCACTPDPAMERGLRRLGLEAIADPAARGPLSDVLDVYLDRCTTGIDGSIVQAVLPDVGTVPKRLFLRP